MQSKVLLHFTVGMPHRGEANQKYRIMISKPALSFSYALHLNYVQKLNKNSIWSLPNFSITLKNHPGRVPPGLSPIQMVPF